MASGFGSLVSAWLLAVGLLGTACERAAAPRPQATPARSAEPAKPVDAAHVAELPRTLGNARHGHELVERFECNRCHDGTGLEPAPLAKNCFSCHEQIISGRFPVSAAALARFRPHVQSAREAPSLVAIGARLEPGWIRQYLLKPHDLRPLLTPTMPRLALDPQDAEDIVAYLTGAESGDTLAAASEPLAGANSRAGRELMEQKGCASCHAFTGAPAFIVAAAPIAGSDSARAAALAVDLRFTRQRFRPDRLLRWLMDPKAVKPDTRMPSFGLSRDEARDIAAYLLSAPLSVAAPESLARLPVLTRRVAFGEVDQRVFSRTCHHCHTDAETAGGDGGPGNTGGFGFAPRGVSFSSHSSILAGYIDARGQRRSLFEPLPDGTPRLVAALLARHDEERGTVREGIRGMPLGLPALTAEEIQLVESWVAQGKPL